MSNSKIETVRVQINAILFVINIDFQTHFTLLQLFYITLVPNSQPALVLEVKVLLENNTSGSVFSEFLKVAVY